jgi:hypothetical protein
MGSLNACNTEMCFYCTFTQCSQDSPVLRVAHTMGLAAHTIRLVAHTIGLAALQVESLVLELLVI